MQQSDPGSPYLRLRIAAGECLLTFLGVHENWGFMPCLGNRVASILGPLWLLLTSLRVDGSMGPMMCWGAGIFTDTQGWASELLP